MADINIQDQTITIQLIPKAEFDRVRAAELDTVTRLHLLADMSRANALSIVKRAGSGHLGSSLSAMEIVTWLYFHEMNTVELGVDHPDRDIYFSSKGHDVPGQYAAMYAAGILSRDKILALRRLGGLDGHPDKGVTGIEANTGSLGMGISKGKGMAWAKRAQRHGGRVFVMLGDGELQEGQNYEGLHSAAMLGIDNLTCIVDHNKLQSDKLVSEIMHLGDLETIFGAFGWHVARVDGNDIAQLIAAWDGLRDKTGPKLIIADTIKGRGVSFMEHPYALATNNGTYPWHAGAPDDEAHEAGFREIVIRVNDRLIDHGLEPLHLDDVTPEPKLSSGVTKERVAVAYGDYLVELGRTRKDIVVLDADLAADIRVREFELTWPARFIELGIAEQDMVSTAAGIASQGMLPIVNSFASFLVPRANEQIYNSATEHNKIIYACHFAGLIPAGPGKSHQSLRDISLFGALPETDIIQPANTAETRATLDYAVDPAVSNSVVIRLAIGPSPRRIDLPAGYVFTRGQGVTLHPGNDALLFAYGPVMLAEALSAAELLAEQGTGVQVVNMPWLNVVDPAWLRETVGDHSHVFVLEDHAPVGGLGDSLLNVLVSERLLGDRHFEKFAVEGFPACGTPAEALRFHRLDGESLAWRITSRLG